MPDMRALTNSLLTPSWMERWGLLLVALTFLSLVTAYQIEIGLALPPLLTSLALGAVAIASSYWLVRATLTDCAPIALATAAGLTVLPGHIVAITSDYRVLYTEILIGLSLVGLVHLSRRGMTYRSVRPSGITTPQFVAFVGTIVVTLAITMLSARWGSGESLVNETNGAQGAGFLRFFRSASEAIEIFWLGPDWTGYFLGLVLALVSIVAIFGGVRYGVATIRGESGLDEAERAGVIILFLAVFSGGVATIILSASAVFLRPAFFYAVGGPLVLLGIIGFESWFPSAARPVAVLGLLVTLFGFNLWHLAV
jgi:hypothetical protein